MAQKLTPLHDRVVIRRIEDQETVRGGIIIPDSAKEKPQEGEVIAVGKGKSNDEGKVFPLDVKEGDRVLFGSTPAPRSRLTAKISSFCGKRRFSASCKAPTPASRIRSGRPRDQEGSFEFQEIST